MWDSRCFESRAWEDLYLELKSFLWRGRGEIQSPERQIRTLFDQMPGKYCELLSGI